METLRGRHEKGKTANRSGKENSKIRRTSRKVILSDTTRMREREKERLRARPLKDESKILRSQWLCLEGRKESEKSRKTDVAGALLNRF